MSRVLIADDDPDIRALVTFKLEQAGYSVVAVADGAAAITAAQDGGDFHLALLDVMMPRMSGIEVCEALRAEPTTATMRIMMLTAKAQERDVERGFTAGADDYIVKPFSPRELLSRVNAALGRPRK